MKKDFIKGIAAGCALSVSIGCAVCFAEPYISKIEAIYDDIKIVVSGKQITPRDANGNTVEPFISNGTTYLPVRAISNALGQSVDWDEATNTVYIGGKTVSGDVDMSTIKAFKGENFKTVKDAVFSLRQEKISPDNCLMFGDNNGSLFILDGKYKSLKGLYAISDNCFRETDKKAIRFLNKDTGEVLGLYTNSKGEKAVEVNVNLVGVDKLEIQGGHISSDRFSSNYSGKFQGYGSMLYNVYLTPIKTK